MVKMVWKNLPGRGTALAFGLIYALLATIGSTYSWTTSSNLKANEFTGELGLTALIVEDFEQQKHWQPGSDIMKTVSVYNEGKSPGFVRISFEEIIQKTARSDISEPYANPRADGVIPEYCLIDGWASWKDAGEIFSSVEFREGADPITPEDLIVKVKASASGLQRYQYAIYQALGGGQAYRRVTAQFSAEGSKLTVVNPRYWGFLSTESEAEAAWGMVNETSLLAPSPPAAKDIAALACDPVKKISINYTNLTTALTGAAADRDKWFYNSEDGFFYYIGRVEPGQVTRTLMTGLSLDADADVSYSRMGLKFIVNMQALQVNAAALATGWELDTSGALYAVLSSFC
ncbi:MAG: hypothetical protein FWH26_05580 [Oscillospiraceae bacterium]|nr:hypothetical protein [Oscillospiraceae bacterium]